MYLEDRVAELERRLAVLESRVLAPEIPQPTIQVPKPIDAKTTKIRQCAVDAHLAVAMQACHSDADFVRLAQTRLKQIALPATLGGFAVDQIIAAASSAPQDNDEKDRVVYMLVNDDCSLGRVGEGKTEPIRDHRPLMHMTAFLINTDPVRRLRPPVWAMSQKTYDMIGRNGARASYIILAKELSKKQSAAGEQAVFDLMGIQKNGGWLINEHRN